jgi:hypothetical protein
MVRVVHVGLKYASQTLLVEYHDLVGSLTPNAADGSFCLRVSPSAVKGHAVTIFRK